jgi:hypothetical protein
MLFSCMTHKKCAQKYVPGCNLFPFLEMLILRDLFPVPEKSENPL